MKGVQALKVQPASGAVLAWVWKYVAPLEKVGLPETLFACRHLRHQVRSRQGLARASLMQQEIVNFSWEMGSLFLSICCTAIGLLQTAACQRHADLRLPHAGKQESNVRDCIAGDNLIIICALLSW